MTLSMTGFARREARTPQGAFAWEVRAVNHRYLEPSLRLPEDFRALEPELREAIAARLSRGKVDATLRHEPAAVAQGLTLDHALARQVAEAAAALGRTTGVEGRPGAMELLRWPGVVVAASPDPAALHATARELLVATLDELVANRRREGAKLATAIEDRAAALAALVAAQRARIPALAAALRDRLQARLAELGATVDPARFEQEVALIVAKSDVAEELDRLEVHLAELKSTLARGAREPVGRKLDFLMQEFNREANTFGSKSQDAESTKAAVAMKVLIEQMREQVQNIE